MESCDATSNEGDQENKDQISNLIDSMYEPSYN